MNLGLLMELSFQKRKLCLLGSILSIFVVIYWLCRASHGCRSLLSFATALM